MKNFTEEEQGGAEMIPKIVFVKDLDKKLDVKNIKKVKGRLIWS